MIYIAICLLIAFTFYDSIYAFLVLMPGVFFYIRYIKEILKRKRINLLRRQFQDMIDSISSALLAGYSIENAFYESHKDMIRLYGKGSLIVNELEFFFSLLEIGTPLEKILSDFADRAKVEDISDFSEIFVLAKRNGGDFNSIITKTVKVMKEKDDTEKEIGVILTGRKYEQRLMCIIPFGIIIYLRISGGGFLKVLYHNILGISVMTLCLIIYIISYYLSIKLIDIKV
ncbi:MAG: hypothetical protein K6E98_07890 [Lachnospiraceae bacterium]|nr:hypothetical protein [Lachnospiraceae bacterium]